MGCPARILYEIALAYFTGGTFICVLTDDTDPWDETTGLYLDEIEAYEIDDASYSRQTLGSVTINQGTGTPAVHIDADNPLFEDLADADQDVGYANFVLWTGDASTSPILQRLNAGSITAVGNGLMVILPTNGFFALNSVAA